jgi:hypothetical protein
MSNLSIELINEMQKTNSPHVFNIDSDGNQHPPQMQQQFNQGPMQQQFNQFNAKDSHYGGGQQQMAGGQQQMAGGQQQMPSNTIQQQFMYALQQNPELQKSFNTPESLQQVLNNNDLMQNVISRSQQPVAQPVVQQAQPIQSQQYLSSDNVTGSQGPVQDENIEEIDLPDKEVSLIDSLLYDMKVAVIATMIYLVVVNKSFQSHVLKLLSISDESTMMVVSLFAVIFFVLTFIVKKTFDILG